MRKLRTPVLVGAAVATFAGCAAFAAVSMTDNAAAANTAALTTTANSTATTNTTIATAKTGTTLSMAVSKTTIQAGRLDVIHGTLTTGSVPNGGRIVELYRYDAKVNRWAPVRVNLTHKGGSVRFAIRPLTTAEYELVYHGNATLAASHSSPVTVTVTT